MHELSRKRVLVTGASQGIGAAVALACAKAGAEVLLVARNDAALKQVHDRIVDDGGTARCMRCDLSSRTACRDLAADCGDIDVLVNNAALTALSLKGVEEVEDAYWDAAIMLNFIVPKTLMECFCPGMMRRGNGSVINMSSIGARFGTPKSAPYSTMKAALEQLTRIASMEMAPAGVRVNAIAPGLFATDAMENLLNQGEEIRRSMISAIPAGRMGHLEEIGALCVFLASDAGAYINGSVLTIDGARTAGMFVPM